VGQINTVVVRVSGTTAIVSRNQRRKRWNRDLHSAGKYGGAAEKDWSNARNEPAGASGNDLLRCGRKSVKHTAMPNVRLREADSRYRLFVGCLTAATWEPDSLSASDSSPGKSEMGNHRTFNRFPICFPKFRKHQATLPFSTSAFDSTGFGLDIFVAMPATTNPRRQSQ
jgi:hypothetical protein